MQNEDLSKYIGIPYKLNGRDIDGTDCLGLVWMYLKGQGITVPDGDELPIDETWQDNAESRFIKALDVIADRVKNPQKNDIVLLHHCKQWAHIGVMLDNQYMLHLPNEQGSERCLASGYGSHRIIGFWRVKR